MTTKELIQKAKDENYAIGAFNAANLETITAIVHAAKKLSSPVLIEASEGEAKYAGIKVLSALVRVFKYEFNLPIILNLDHASSYEICKEAIDAGFDYVHFDGSKLPFDENVKIAKEIVKYAHDHNVMVEGEIDHIEGSSADHTNEDPLEFQKNSHYTNPEQAFEFVSKTGIDVFASFIGNLHGMYAEEVHLRLDILDQIIKALPNTYLSLHGGSGIVDDEVRKAVKNGIVKVNVNSELRIAYKKALTKSLTENDEVAIYKITPPAIKAVEEVVEKKIMLFGSNNKHDLKRTVFLPVL